MATKPIRTSESVLVRTKFDKSVTTQVFQRYRRPAFRCQGSGAIKAYKGRSKQSN
jgi:hypothetical protein